MHSATYIIFSQSGSQMWNYAISFLYLGQWGRRRHACYSSPAVVSHISPLATRMPPPHLHTGGGQRSRYSWPGSNLEKHKNNQLNLWIQRSRFMSQTGRKSVINKHFLYKENVQWKQFLKSTCKTKSSGVINELFHLKHSSYFTRELSKISELWRIDSLYYKEIFQTSAN